MTVKLSHLARHDLEDIRSYTLERWGRAQWFDYYRGLVAALEKIEANPRGAVATSSARECARLTTADTSFSFHPLTRQAVNLSSCASCTSGDIFRRWSTTTTWTTHDCRGVANASLADTH